MALSKRDPLEFAGVGRAWSAAARKWFKGPVVQGTEEELRAIEREFETPGPATTSPAK